MHFPEAEAEAEAAEPDWLCPEPGGPWSHEGPGSSSSAPFRTQCHGKRVPAESRAQRVIVHTDLDCFYAQVEMIHNPELRDKPLGVQQKYLVVTCNYEARKLGIKKLMSVRDAKEKCPQLVLVNGEDLTQYREMSYKVTELLEEFSPFVERLGFDENFVDITELVERRLAQLQRDDCSKVSVSGHVYNNQTVNLHDVIHIRLVIGSQIAAEMREALYNRLGLTGCAGVASNKLLSKLVSGTFKPNQQTVLLPESCRDLIGSLDHIRKVPGIGYKTAKRLELLGLSSVRDLQTFSPVILEKELGVSIAQHIQKLSYGEDDSPVTPSGPPQSLSDEDSFKKCSSEVEVKKKIEELLANLLDRISKDGRKPHTVRLTIRKFSSTNKWFNRESRQCPIPSHIIQKFGTGNHYVLAPLVGILMKLFKKMIKVELPFHLTLLSVCFSNLKAFPSLTKGSIGFYLAQSSSPASSDKVRCAKSTSFVLGSLLFSLYICPELTTFTSTIRPTTYMQTLSSDTSSPLTSPQKMEAVLQDQVNCNFVPAGRIRSTRTRESSLETKSSTEETGKNVCPFQLLPAGIDQEVFSQLPEDIKGEIISGKTGERILTNNVLNRVLPFPQGALPFFAQEQMNSPSNSRRADHSISSWVCSEDFTPHSKMVTSVVHRPNPNSILNPQDPPEYPESALMDDCMKQVPEEALNFSSTNSIIPNLWSQQHFLQLHSSDSQEQPSGTASQDKSHEEQVSGEGRIVFPSNVDPDIFSELPSEMQKELLAEWKNLKAVSKMHVNKPSEKLKTNKGKKNVVCSSQSNSLLRYFKPK
ncbi:DNA polymerase iota isoform X2 [Carettochelys insculpta]|uniref:DNA polymerase iota isoform X2 n=1 Tax=Carettochelys insculpta TaxID=44489 RepID=UPI003EBE450D